MLLATPSKMSDLKAFDIILEKLKKQIEIMKSGENKNLSEKNETRLRTFIGEIKKIAPMNVYLIFDTSSSWYSDMDRDDELSLTLHSNCSATGNISFKAEVVTNSQHAREIVLEILGEPTEAREDVMMWGNV